MTWLMSMNMFMKRVPLEGRKTLLSPGLLKSGLGQVSAQYRYSCMQVGVLGDVHGDTQV